MASQRPPDDNPRRRANPNRNGDPKSPPAANTYQPIARPRSNPQPPPPPDKLFNDAARQQSRPRRQPPRSMVGESAAAPRRPSLPFKVGPMLGYLALVVLVVGGLSGLFVATRLYGFLNKISVERQDASGQVISQSSVTGKGRVNIVLLGLDRRPIGDEGTRSDSMILVSVDQDNKTAHLLSVPRDLWVKVPGHGNNRINTAYFFGEQSQPGKGGPPLVKETVQENFGIRVDYFIEIDFNGFRSIIDALGGITVDVKKPLVDNEYPTEDFGIKRIYVPAGIQRMNGQVALEYARSRHADSDLGRNQRQQEVLLAVREQGVNLNLLTNTKLQAALQGTVKTDLTPGDIVALGQMAVGMKREAIRQFSIDANIARNTNISGNEVLVADQTLLRQLLRDFQASNSAAATPARETARISLLNGTFTQGRAARTQKFLEGKGYTIESIDQAGDAGKYPLTVINVYNGKRRTADELAVLLGVTPDRIRVKIGGSPGVDIEVICGEELNLPE